MKLLRIAAPGVQRLGHFSINWCLTKHKEDVVKPRLSPLPHPLY